MKYFASLSMAAMLAVGLISAVQAQPTDNSESGMSDRSVVGADYWAQHHPCVGLASGTAHHSCGTLTGGPSGGLF